MFISQSSYMETLYSLDTIPILKPLITSHPLGHILVVSSSFSVTDVPEELTEEPVDLGRNTILSIWYRIIGNISFIKTTLA